MQFQSFAYIVFLLAAALVHRWLRPKWRSGFLLAVSYGFYGLASWRSVPFLLAATLWNYGLGRAIAASDRKKRWLVLGLTVDLGLLFLLKYLGFFGELCALVTGGGTVSLPELLLPAGLSFFTFTACAYLVDVYRGRQVEENLLYFSLHLAFFPAILSGPIERAEHLLPQLKAAVQADLGDWKEGVLRFLVGMWKKLVIADQLAVYVSAVFGAAETASWLQLLLAVLAYTVQIYCDFSAYSDMAIGSARLFGIRLLENFAKPYFSVSVKDFWRRWHMSLSGWFRDYLYFPLGGSRKGKFRTYCNVMIVFAVSGLWHGAAMTFVVWGLLNGLYQVAESFLPKQVQRLPAWLRMLGTLLLIIVAWVFFRADSLAQAGTVLMRICTLEPGTAALSIGKAKLLVAAASALSLFVAEALDEKYRLWARLQQTVVLRHGACVALVVMVLLFGAYGSGYNAQDFVYFQF